MIARGLAIGLLLLCGACGKKVEHQRRSAEAAANDAAADAALPEDGNSEFSSGIPSMPDASLAVTVDGLEVTTRHGVTTRVPFGTSETAVVAAVKPAVGDAEKVFSVPCGTRNVIEHDFANVTLSFEGGVLVSWRAYGTVRMPDGIGEGTPRDTLAAAYPDLRKVPKRPSPDSAEAFAAGPIRGRMRENLVASIDGGKPMCAD